MLLCERLGSTDHGVSRATTKAVIDRISIELTNRCSKGCSFCYNASGPGRGTTWSPEDVIPFVRDCAAHGVRAVSFGGGEPLEYEGVLEVLSALRGTLFRSMTTNGLLLSEARLAELAEARPDKVHVSIHFPDREREVARVVDRVLALEACGVKSGVNLLVARSSLDAAARAAATLRDAGISNERVVYLPMRGSDTPSPEELARVAGTPRFQSMSCLAACAKSERFCAVGWDKTVAWCSYTQTRRALPALTHAGLVRALDGLGLAYCGGTDDDERSELVRLSRRPLDGHRVVRGRS